MDIKDIKNISICGAGTMGSSLCQIFATSGFNVSLFDINDGALETSLCIIESNLHSMVNQNKLTQQEMLDIIDRIKTTTSIKEAAKDADYITEAITEKIDVKSAFYKEVCKYSRNDVIIASNTSYLNIFELIPEHRKPNTLIAHWFAPPHIIPLVEIIKGESTNSETVNLVVELLENIGKKPIILNKFIPGFCVNRIQKAIGREIFYLLDNDIISPKDLDLAVKNSLVPRSLVLGFVQRYDFTGMDLSVLNYQNENYIETPYDNQPRSLFEKVDRGELGVKTGKGFFDYSERSIDEVLKERDIKLERVFAMLNEIGTDPI